MKVHNTFGISGLTAHEVQTARTRYGRNELKKSGQPRIDMIKDIATEPMVILLLAGACIYFVNHEWSDGFFMLAAIAGCRVAKYLHSIITITSPRPILSGG